MVLASRIVLTLIGSIPITYYPYKGMLFNILTGNQTYGDVTHNARLYTAYGSYALQLEPMEYLTMAKRKAKNEVVTNETANNETVQNESAVSAENVESSNPVQEVTSQESSIIPPNDVVTNNTASESDDDNDTDDSELEPNGETEGKKRKNYLKGKKLLFTETEIEEARNLRDSINTEMERDGTKGFVRLYKMISPQNEISYAIGRHTGDCADAILTSLKWVSELMDMKARGRMADPETQLRNADKALDKLTPEQVQALLAKYMQSPEA